jgi:hypothetical protein
MELVRLFRIAGSLAGALACVACAEVGYPSATDLRANLYMAPDVHDVTSARAYIYSARKNFMGQRSDLRNEEGLLDAGIGGGSLTALLAGALHWSAKTVIKATVFSGSSYAGAQTIQPRAQLEIIDSSLAALDCISSKAEAAYPAASTRALVLQPVAAARDQIAIDLQNPALRDPTHAGEAAFQLAQTFINANQSQIYQQVRLGVDATVTVANTQMRKATADPTAVQRAFAGVTVATAPQAPPAGEATQANQPPTPAATQAKLEAFERKTGKQPELTPEELALRQLRLDIDKLNKTMTATQARLDALPANTVVLDLQGCIPGAVILVVSPAGPVSLAPLQSYELTVTGGQHGWSWSGTVPSEIAVTTKSSSLYHLAATKDLQADETYTLVFTPYADGPQKMVTIKSVAPPAKPGG